MELKNDTLDGMVVKTEKVGGPYSVATLNPDYTQFKGMLDSSSRQILEIGCGDKPRMSWQLHSGDLWIGCDPAIRGNGINILVHNGGRNINGARLAVFSDIAAGIPSFHPDILCAVAPNQKDVADGRIFNDELEGFLDRGKHQTFVVVMDKRTWEAKGYQSEAKQAIVEWMKDYGFVADPEHHDLSDFRPNSRDLGPFGGNIRRSFVRN